MITPTPIPPISPDSQSYTIIDIIDALTKEPELVIFTGITSMIASGLFLYAVTHALSNASRSQPITTVITVVLGLLGVMALLAAVIRPQTEALAVAAGTAVGGLSGSLAVAIDRRHKDQREDDTNDKSG